LRRALALLVLLAGGCAPSGAGLTAGPTTAPVAATGAVASPGTGAGVAAAAAAGADKSIRHVLFVLADGAGPAALEWRARAGDALVLLDEIAPAAVHGTVTTDNFDGGITDSAASATALATGFKTKNALCGLGPAGARLTTILEALPPGWRRGVVTDAPAVDASPAAFCAHASRHDADRIASDLVAARLDVLFGGGPGPFLPVAHGGTRADGKDLLAALRASGSTVVTDAAHLADLRGLPAAALLPTTFAPGPASSAALLERALALLAPGDAPFFLFAESEAPDVAGHRNDLAALAVAVATYDAVAAVAWRYYRAHPDDTLVLFTADHETGGLTLTGDAAAFTTTGHTSTPVWLYALGPGASRFAGTIPNTAVGVELFRLLTGAAPPAAP
jgi:alkaline phosphatase